MPQKQRVAIALLLLFVLWCGWQSRLSSQHPSHLAQESAAAISNSIYQNKPEQHWWQDAVAIFTLCLVFVGAAQAVLFLVQLRFIRQSLADAKIAAEAAKESADATKASVELARQTAERQLRAYVAVDQGILKGVGGAETEARLYIKNTGQTPAYNTEQWVSIVADDYPTTRTFEFFPGTAEIGASATIGAGGLSTVFISVGALTANQWDKIRTGKAAIWLWGEIRYRDAFEKRRFTRFKYIYGGHVGARPNGAMAVDIDGNESD
jgi:hypothetical protein